MHGSFNNLLPIENLPSKKYLDRLPSLNDIDLFSLNADNVNNSDLEYSSIHPVRCKYYSPLSFSLLTNKLNKQVFRSQLTLFHNNVCSLKSNLENLQTHLLNKLDFHFNIIGVTETRITNSNFIDFNPNITGYNFEYIPTPLSAGGVGMYIDSDLIIIIIIKLLLIARKLTLEYDQMRVTSRIPKNYKKCFKKNYIHHIKTKIRHIKNYLHRIKNKITSN